MAYSGTAIGPGTSPGNVKVIPPFFGLESFVGLRDVIEETRVSALEGSSFAFLAESGVGFGC